MAPKLRRGQISLAKLGVRVGTACSFGEVPVASYCDTLQGSNLAVRGLFHFSIPVGTSNLQLAQNVEWKHFRCSHDAVYTWTRLGHPAPSLAGLPLRDFGSVCVWNYTSGQNIPCLNRLRSGLCVLDSVDNLDRWWQVGSPNSPPSSPRTILWESQGV